jgi:hypothetical protein
MEAMIHTAMPPAMSGSKIERPISVTSSPAATGASDT